MPEIEREVRLYRGLSLFVGSIYLLWWLAVSTILPHAFNPLLSRLIVVLCIWSTVAASYFSAAVRRQLRLLWMCALWLVTAHYYYLFYENAGDLNWIVGAFVTVSAVTLGFLSRASLILYSVYAGALSVAMVIMLPALAGSVFLPGLVTVLLQANVGLQSRLGVIRDLAASKEHFQLLFNSTFEGVLIHEGGRIVQVNDSLLAMFGFSSDEVVGHDLVMLVHPDERASISEKIRLETILPYQTRAISKDGSVIDIEVRGKPLSAGQGARRLVTLQDITERKMQAAALQQSNAALARSNVELQRFAHVASHDLQTPLRSIASFVDLIRANYEQALDAQGKDWLLRTGQSVTHLQALISDLLDYARVDANARPFSVVSMRAVFDRSLALLDAAVKEAQARIIASDLPEVMGDGSQLVQLMMNLIANAIKYRRELPPCIHVAAEDKGDEWLFSVRDNGIGIAAKHYQRVFEIFRRLHDAKEYPGTGIGLALCRRVIDHHGGRIWVESELGKGSVFYFTIANAAGRGQA